MIEMPNSEEMRGCEREVFLWLDNKGIPHQSYRNLPTHNKVVLRNLVCIPTHTTTYTQRKNLYRTLCLSASIIAGRESVDPADFMPDEELKKFFTPVPPSETLSYLEKF